MAEEADLKSVKCEFDSHLGHMKLDRVAAFAAGWVIGIGFGIIAPVNADETTPDPCSPEPTADISMAGVPSPIVVSLPADIPTDSVTYGPGTPDPYVIIQNQKIKISDLRERIRFLKWQLKQVRAQG